MTPQHSIDYCPICGGGLCGIRICGTEDPQPHGLVVCDECEAVWLEPDTLSEHQYLDPCDTRCPICHRPLWGSESRWATADDVAALGWQSAVDANLDHLSD